MTRTCRQIVADHRRHYPHPVKLANAGGWRDRHCAHKAREIMSGPLVQWFEGGLWVYGFKTAQQAAAFKAWPECCGIDWSVPASEQPQETRPQKPPQGPVHGAVALNRIKPPWRPSPAAVPRSPEAAGSRGAGARNRALGKEEEKRLEQMDVVPMPPERRRTMDISTDLAAVRVPDDEVGLYNVTGGGWYAFNGEDKAVLGPFESLGECDLAIRDWVSLLAPPDLFNSVPKVH